MRQPHLRAAVLPCTSHPMCCNSLLFLEYEHKTWVTVKLWCEKHASTSGWFGGKVIWEENQIAVEKITYLNFSDFWKSWCTPPNVKSRLCFVCEKYCIHELTEGRPSVKMILTHKELKCQDLRALGASRPVPSLPTAGIPSIQCITWCLRELSRGHTGRGWFDHCHRSAVFLEAPIKQ